MVDHIGDHHKDALILVCYTYTIYIYLVKHITRVDDFLLFCDYAIMALQLLFKYEFSTSLLT